MTATNGSNPWWSVFKQAVEATGGKLAKPEILASTTDARYIRTLGIPLVGFSPMINTPILLHDHNEVLERWYYLFAYLCVPYFESQRWLKYILSLLQFLKDTVFLKGIEVYESVISALSSFEGVSDQAIWKHVSVQATVTGRLKMIKAHTLLWPRSICCCFTHFHVKLFLSTFVRVLWPWVAANNSLYISVIWFVCIKSQTLKEKCHRCLEHDFTRCWSFMNLIPFLWVAWVGEGE